MDAPDSRRARLREIAGVFTKLGFTAFGGPAAHVAMMEDQVVTRRRWLDRQHFLDLLAAINFIPGPSSTELAIQLGLLRAGGAGLIVAGICFIVPAVLIILPLGWMYVTYAYASPRGDILAALAGVKACVVAIIAAAVMRFAKTSVKDRFTAIVAVFAAIASAMNDPKVAGLLQGHHLLPAIAHRFTGDLAILSAAAVAGMFRYGRPGMPLGATPMLLPLAAVMHEGSPFREMAIFFLKVGATLFGSGYVLVSYLQTGLVDQRHWLSQQQLLDAIAIGQVTPGPLLTTATFIGYVLGHAKFGGGVPGGIAGACLATAAIFLPSFIFVSIIGPILPRLRRLPAARGALDGANAAVVALICVVAVRLALSTLHGPLTIAIASGSLWAMLAWQVSSTPLIFLSATVGVAGYYVSGHTL